MLLHIAAYPEPELIDFEGDFGVNMYRRAKGTFGANNEITQTPQTTQTTQTPQTIPNGVVELSEEDKAILTIVHDKPTLTQKEYALELGWTVDRVKYYLKKMKSQQMVKRVGSIHHGHWEVLIEETLKTELNTAGE